MNKKGFTLVELLAVVVILALLALLTSTAVTKLVKDAKNDLSETQMTLIKSAADTWIADNLNKLPSSGSCGYLTLEDLKYYGLLDNTILDPKNSEEIANDLKIKITTTTSAYGNPVTTAEVNPESIEGCSQIYFPICTIAEDSTVTGLNAGAKYNCKVDPNKDEYTFYILTSATANASTVNMIMDSNINISGEPVKEGVTDKGLVPWINNTHFLEMGGSQTDWDNFNSRERYGPITAIDYLNTATQNWTNLNSMIINKFEACPSNSICEVKELPKTYTTYSRMPYLSEVGETGCNLDEGSCPSWMVDYMADRGYQKNVVSGVFAYWTLSFEVTDFAWFVYYDAFTGSNHVPDGAPCGVRPVITVPVNRIIQMNQ